MLLKLVPLLTPVLRLLLVPLETLLRLVRWLQQQQLLIMVLRLVLDPLLRLVLPKGPAFSRRV